MGRRTKNNFDESSRNNNYTYRQYFDRLMELSISMFDWKNLPDSIDSRYMELKLFERGSIVWFEDDILNKYLCLECLPQGMLDVYGYPINRRAFSGYNNYQKNLDDSNSVIIWNNFIRTNSVLAISNFAQRLYNLDRIIDVNVNAQKTPILVQGSEHQRLTLKNIYKEFDGNSPVIFGDKNLDINALKVLKTDAPFIADKIYTLKMEIWNEALTYLGISNTNITKKERMVTDEVVRNMGGVIASRYSRLESRRQGCDKINKMFGLNISVDYREDYREMDDEFILKGESSDNGLDRVVNDLNTDANIEV